MNRSPQDFDLELLDEDLDIGGNLPSSRDRRSGSGVRTGHDPDSPEVKAKVVKMEHALAGRFKEFGLSEGGTFPKCLDEDKMDLRHRMLNNSANLRTVLMSEVTLLGGGIKVCEERLPIAPDDIAVVTMTQLLNSGACYDEVFGSCNVFTGPK